MKSDNKSDKLRQLLTKTAPPSESALVSQFTVLRRIQRAENGLSLLDILGRNPALSRRTAQRWIGEWLASGQISAHGQGRARRYAAIGVFSAEKLSGNRATQFIQTAPFPDYISLTEASPEILSYLALAPEARKPVGYQTEFLESYQPNKTWYLSAALRRKLWRLGQTAAIESPAGTYSRAILNRLLIDLSWASSHLEGNTYSRLDTRELVEHGRAAIGKGAQETQMILNHKAAIELLVENIDSVQLNHFTLCNLHSALSENLLPNPADEGRVRLHGVEISRSVYRPLAGARLLETRLAQLLNKASQINDPFEQSFFMMVHLPYLQPFADINKRTSRLAANLPLFRANLCPLTFIDVPDAAYSRGVLGVYELTQVDLLRDVYVWAYERSAQEYLAVQQTLAQPDPLRLTHRDLIKLTVRRIVQAEVRANATQIKRQIATAVKTTPSADRAMLAALIDDELHRLHQGVLARYGVRLAEFARWQAAGSEPVR